jgi:hypothetical protein
VAESFHKNRRDAFIILGAILTIIAGVLSLMNGVEGLFSKAELDPFSSSSSGLGAFCGVVLIVFGVIAIAGGAYALRPRPHLTPLLLGAAMGMLGGGDTGFFLGLAAIVLFWLANVDL